LIERVIRDSPPELARNFSFYTLMDEDVSARETLVCNTRHKLAINLPADSLRVRRHGPSDALKYPFSNALPDDKHQMMPPPSKT
jgi:hypothetical protein